MAFRSSVDELPEPVKRRILSHTVGLAGLHLSLAASRRRSVRRLPVRKQSGRAKGRCLAFVPLGGPTGLWEASGPLWSDGRPAEVVGSPDTVNSNYRRLYRRGLLIGFDPICHHRLYSV